jgi:hypothetical protein
VTAETVFGDGGIADQIQEALAQAWDEGANAGAGWELGQREGRAAIFYRAERASANPYRKGIL